MQQVTLKFHLISKLLSQNKTLINFITRKLSTKNKILKEKEKVKRNVLELHKNYIFIISKIKWLTCNLNELKVVVEC